MLGKGTADSMRLAAVLWPSLKPLVEELVQQELDRRATPASKPKRLKDVTVEKGK